MVEPKEAQRVVAMCKRLTSFYITDESIIFLASHARHIIHDCKIDHRSGMTVLA